MRHGVRISNIILLMLSVAWLVTDHSWEPLIVVIGLLSTLIFQEVKTTGGKKPFDHLYQPSHSYDFYNAVAKAYDARNSDFLLNTHRQVIDRINKYVDAKPNWAVLDLAGGTGLLIANHFASSANGKWVCVDWCPEMNSQFQHNFANVNLPIEVVCEPIDDFLVHPRHQDQYDVVVISLALSSMSNDPRWTNIAKFVKVGGALIVAEIEPAYAALHPHFALSIGDKTHALATRPVHSAEVIKHVTASGLVHKETYLVNNRNTTYSYVCVFEKP